MAQKNKTLVVLKYGGIGILAVIAIAILNYIMSIIFSIYFIPEEAYASNFFGYYTSEAHKSMFTHAFKHFADYKYDEKEDNGKVGEWIKKAQGDGKEEGILFDGFPEHFPRGPKYYYSLNFDWNDEIFLKFRKDLVKNEGKELEEKVKSGEINLSDKKIHYWEKPANEIIDEFMENPRFSNVVSQLRQFFNNLKGQKYKDGDKIGSTYKEESRILDDIRLIFEKSTGSSTDKKNESDEDMKITNRDVYDALKRSGEIVATPMERFIYSRMVYMIYFLSLYSKEGEELAYKDEKTSKEALFDIADGVAYILSGVYKHPIGTKQENGGFLSKVRKFYVPKVKIDKNKAQSSSERVYKILNTRLSQGN